jgi:hypothetical protein
MKKVFLLLAIITLAISGCASRELSLQRASATTIPGNYLPTDIKVDGIHRSFANVDWIAYTSDGKKFRCSADDMVRRPTCKQ